MPVLRESQLLHVDFGGPDTSEPEKLISASHAILSPISSVRDLLS